MMKGYAWLSINKCTIVYRSYIKLRVAPLLFHCWKTCPQFNLILQKQLFPSCSTYFNLNGTYLSTRNYYCALHSVTFPLLEGGTPFLYISNHNQVTYTHEPQLALCLIILRNALREWPQQPVLLIVMRTEVSNYICRFSAVQVLK